MTCFMSASVSQKQLDITQVLQRRSKMLLYRKRFDFLLVSVRERYCI